MQSVSQCGSTRLSNRPSRTFTAPYAYVFSWLTRTRHTGRIGLGHQQYRISEIKPKRASSWNITSREESSAQPRDTVTISRSFFPSSPVPADRTLRVACQVLTCASCADAEDCRRMQVRHFGQDGVRGPCESPRR